MVIRFLGRFFLSIIFIIFGAASLINWDVSYTDLDAAIVNWQMYKGNVEVIGGILDLLVSYTAILVAVGIFLQIVGGLSVILGIKPRLGGLLLALYLIVYTNIYYPFWFYTGEQMMFNLVLYLKNLSIFGGVLLLFSHADHSVSIRDFSDDEI